MHANASFLFFARQCDDCALDIYTSKEGEKRKKKSETHLHFSFLCCCLCHKLADQWIQYDLGPPRQITGVVTRGHGGWESKQRHHVSWVSSYTLSYSNDTLLWFSYRDGNHLDPKVSTLFLFPISSKLKNFFFFLPSTSNRIYRLFFFLRSRLGSDKERLTIGGH